MIYLVSTPIGNIEDISVRALNTIKNSEIVLVENKKTFFKLANILGINLIGKKLISFNETTEKKIVTENFLLSIKDKTVSVVSSAGTPTISDPGFKLVKLARKLSIPVTAIPGPVAFITALTISGLPTDKIIFLGFAPRKEGKFKKLLEEFKDLNKVTFAIYISVYKIKKYLKLILEIFKNHDIIVARELTKKFEEIITINNLEDIDKIKEKGEFVVLWREKDDC